MKICFVSSQAISQHATLKRSFGMSGALSRMGHEVTIMLLDHPDNRAQMELIPNVRGLYFPPSNFVVERNWKSCALNEGDFDVVFISALGFRNAVRTRRSRPIVLMEHCELESSIIGNPPLRRLSQFALEWASLFQYDGTIAASKYLENVFKHRLFTLGMTRPICWLPYAFSPEELATDSKVVEQLERKMLGRNLIVSLGTVNTNYGSLVLLDALRCLRKRRTDWIAICPGKGRDLEQTREYCRALGLDDVVSFPGYVPKEHVGSYLQTATTVVSHLNDTLQDWARCPSKVYLYMGAKKPIVTPHIGENAVALGSNGFYYDSRNSESMANALSSALDADKSGWKPSNPEQHTWNARADQWLEWLRQEFPRIRSSD